MHGRILSLLVGVFILAGLLLVGPVAAQLDFEYRRIGSRCSLGGHGLRGVFQTDSKDGCNRLWVNSGQLPDGFAGLFTFEIPHGAIDGIARATCG